MTVMPGLDPGIQSLGGTSGYPGLRPGMTLNFHFQVDFAGLYR
jgi:hypothetical protein